MLTVRHGPRMRHSGLEVQTHRVPRVQVAVEAHGATQAHDASQREGAANGERCERSAREELKWVVSVGRLRRLDTEVHRRKAPLRLAHHLVHVLWCGVVDEAGASGSPPGKSEEIGVRTDDE